MESRFQLYFMRWDGSGVFLTAGMALVSETVENPAGKNELKWGFTGDS